MDNQQVTDFELGWLSGILDGEGCFTLSKGSNGGFSPSIKIVNIDEIILHHIEMILIKLKLSYFIYDSHRSGNQRPAKRIEINGIMRVKRALDLFLPYILAKQKQAKLLLKWVDYRLNVPQRTPTDPDEWLMYKELQDLKR